MAEPWSADRGSRTGRDGRLRVGLVTGRPALGSLLVRELPGDLSLVLLDPSGGAASWLADPSPLDVLLVDGTWPAALEVCRAVQAQPGRPRAIVLAAPPDAAWAVRAFQAGARGVIPEDPVEAATRGGDAAGSMARVSRAVRAVARGEVGLPPGVAGQAIDAVLAAGRRRPATARVQVPGLSGREREVLTLAASGLRNREIAARLGITEATVKAHLTRVFRKVGVQSRVQLAARYHQEAPPAP